MIQGFRATLTRYIRSASSESAAPSAQCGGCPHPAQEADRHGLRTAYSPSPRKSPQAMPSGTRSGTSTTSSSPWNGKTPSPPPDTDSAERPPLLSIGRGYLTPRLATGFVDSLLTGLHLAGGAQKAN